MSVLFDARGNELQGSLDQIGNGSFTDARVASGTLNAVNGEVFMDLNGKAVAVFDIRSAANSATYVFEGTVDGTNYFTLAARGFKGTIAATVVDEAMTAAVVVSSTAAASYIVGCSGLRRVRCRVSAFTSGSAVVTARASVSDYAIIAAPQPSMLAIQVQGAANAIATITLPAAGAGLFHYITSISWYRHCTAALAGTGAFAITSTNLPTGFGWRIGNAIAIGQNLIDVDFQPSFPLKSSVANTNTTIVAAAAGAAVLTTGLCTYYVGA
jgi:hypothetical protein